MSRLIQRLFNEASSSESHVTDQPALIEGEIRWTLAELKEKIVRLAAALQAEGIQPGDRVAILFANQKEYLVSFFAILYAGAIVVPVNMTMAPSDILHVILDSGSRLILTTHAFAHHFEHAGGLPVWVANVPPTQENASATLIGRVPLVQWEDRLELGDPEFTGIETPDETALRILMYTSGTTGKPKGVMLSELNLISNLEGIAPVLPITSTDRMLLALPLFHAYGQMIALYALQQRTALYLIPHFAPKQIVSVLVTEKITLLPLVPTLFSMLLQSLSKLEAGALSSLKACISGGASLPKRLLHQIESALNIVVLEGYGLTETSPVVAVNNPKRGSIPGSVGSPLSNLDIRLLSETGEVIPWKMGEASAEGEITIKGPSVMLGYYHLPEETAMSFDEQGYFRTGDLGILDAEGHLFISGGRKKDLIIKAGENIAPVRIESVLYEHPAVLQAAVIGVPDEKLGENIKACITLKPGQVVSEKELKQFCLEHLPPFMIPAQIEFYEELPKNQVGKIMKNELRAVHQARPEAVRSV